ncbi:MAG TPA: phage tail tube protein [Mesorhizobium sp.]|jgi:hypothetical protein|nr:phage tail tube protein [Mesorhizobium sp.]
MADAALSLVAGAKVYVSGVISSPVLAEFENVSRTWTEVKGVTAIGAFGDEAEIATLQTIDGARVRKRKGTRDAGTLELTVGRDPADAGQVALRAAEKTSSVYALKIVGNDAPEGGDPTIYYLAGVVASAKNEMAGANDFVSTVFSVAIDAQPVIVEASA